jgi:hypothetical protein
MAIPAPKPDRTGLEIRPVMLTERVSLIGVRRGQGSPPPPPAPPPPPPVTRNPSVRLAVPPSGLVTVTVLGPSAAAGLMVIRARRAVRATNSTSFITIP